MKTLKYKYVFILILALSLTYSINARDEATKKYHEVYEVKQGQTLTLENKFGDIDILNWDKNQVSIDVAIIIEHVNEEKAKKLLDYINVNFTRIGDEIIAKTEFKEGFDKISSSIFSLGTTDYSINYTVKMPDYLNLNVLNKYGNAFINKVTGIANLKVKYGNLKINEILRGNEKPMSVVDLGYGNANIEKCEWLKFNIEYSKVKLEHGKALDVYSRYSNFNIGESSSLITNSKYRFWLDTLPGI